MSKETGGPAFPVPGYKFVDQQHFTRLVKAERGQTLRDHFAGLAIQSIPLPLDANEQKLIATAAYRMADAMLEARKS